MAVEGDQDHLEANGNQAEAKEDGEKLQLDEELENDRTLLCGLGKWRPKFLQPFSRPGVILAFFVSFSLTAGKQASNLC